MNPVRITLIVWAMLAQTAAAQQLMFAQDFEVPGSEDGSDGGWTVFEGAFANLQVERSAVAAVSGDAGLRITRVASALPAGPARLRRLFAPPTEGRAYARVWFRLSPQSGPVTVSPMQLRATAIGSLSHPWIGRTPTDAGDLDFRSSSAPAGTGEFCPRHAAFEFGTWHLLEVDNWGVGSADAGYAGYLDGVLTCSAAISYEGVQARDIYLGVHAGSEFEGQMDFDALAVATAPLPSKVVLTAAELDGGCLAISAHVSASTDGGFMPSPLTVTWSALEPGGVPAQPCDSSPAEVTFSALDEPRHLVALPLRSGATVLATAPNLLPGMLQLSVDAGPGPTAARTLGVACGCGSGGQALPQALLAIWLALFAASGQRRRSQRDL